ncbi:MAG: LppX_LprAFG lipoprotein [Ktedonobacteraceae bacterium]
MHKRSGYGFLLVLLLVLAACGGGSSSSGPSTPDAHQLITKAQAAIQKVTAYHFNLKAVNIGANAVLPINSADGDIKVPDRLKATANALFAGNNVQVQLIAIGNQQYINVFGGWQTATGLLDPRTLSDPQTGVAAILGHIQNPSTPTDSSVGGRSCWNIKGKLDPKYLAGITGGGAPAGQLDDVSTCIGKSDNLPYQIIINGVATQGDTAKTVRTFTLSKFGEPLNIQAPAVTASTSALTPTL